MHFSKIAECLRRRGIIECLAPHVRPEIEFSFYYFICLQVLSQTWQVPLLKLSAVKYYSAVSDLPLTGYVSFALRHFSQLWVLKKHIQIHPVPKEVVK